MSIAELLGETPAAIDAERLVQWALAPGRQGGLRWRGDVALSFDQGLTAKPRRKPRGSWALIEAGAVVATRAANAAALRAIADPDAACVHAAIQALSEPARSLVLLHGRRRSRPSATETVVRLVSRKAPSGRPWIAYQDSRRRRYPFCVLDLDRREIASAAADGAVAAWLGGLVRVAAIVAGELQRWVVSATLPNIAALPSVLPVGTRRLQSPLPLRPDAIYRPSALRQLGNRKTD